MGYNSERWAVRKKATNLNSRDEVITTANPQAGQFPKNWARPRTSMGGQSKALCVRCTVWRQRFHTNNQQITAVRLLTGSEYKFKSVRGKYLWYIQQSINILILKEYLNMSKFSFKKVKSPREKSTQDKKKSTEEKGANKPTENKFSFTSNDGSPQWMPIQLFPSQLGLGKCDWFSGKIQGSCLATSQGRD